MRRTILALLLRTVLMLITRTIHQNYSTGIAITTAFQPHVMYMVLAQPRQQQQQQQQHQQQQQQQVLLLNLLQRRHASPSHSSRSSSLSFSSSLSSSSNNNDSNNDDDKEGQEKADTTDGASLAASFFRTVQAKGLNLDITNEFDDDDDDDEEEEEEEENDKLKGNNNIGDDDEEDDDDDEEEMEVNIPQGAINAFLGYDTGNVGAKLSGNVTLTNDQLYSEVKERVLESAGGFLAYVQGAKDDDDDDDDEDIDDIDRQSLSNTEQKPYVVPTTVPDSELTAGEVVLLVLEALRNNDTPYRNKGVEILFGYSSPGSQIKNEIGLTPTEYAEFLQETEYKILFTNRGRIQIDKADYSVNGKKAFFTARLPITNIMDDESSKTTPRRTTISTSASNNTMDTISVNFIVSTTGREDDACWLIDSILIRPQSMRRRRRK
jgi:hypothetical protein